MNFIFWLLTLGTLDDLRDEIRRHGLTPAERSAEDAKAEEEYERDWGTLIWTFVAIPVVAIVMAIIYGLVHH